MPVYFSSLSSASDAYQLISNMTKKSFELEEIEKKDDASVAPEVPLMQSLSVTTTGSRADTPYHKLRRASHNIISGDNHAIMVCVS